MPDRQTNIIVEMIDRVTAPARRVVGSLTGINDRVRNMTGGSVAMSERIDAAITRNAAAARRAQGSLLASGAAFYGITRAIRAPVEAAMAFEEAMADVNKVVEFTAENGLAMFRADLMALSREVPLSVQQLAEIAAGIGEGGFGEDQILAVTEAAAKIGVAFGISAEQAGDAIPNLRNALGITFDQTILVMDAMNHLSNNMASGAGDILNFMTRVGAQAETFGYSAEEAAAFGSAMIATGADANVAATSFRNMGMYLTRGESATARQQDAFERLGMSATQVAADMQRDAVGTSIRVIEALGQMPEEIRASLTSDLFGNEARALAPLLTNTDLLREALGYVAEEAEYAGSSFAEFDVRNATFGSRLRRIMNRVSELAITIGDALMPILSDLFDKVGPIISQIAEWVSANGELIGGILLATAGLIGLNAAVAAVRLIGILSVGRLLRIAGGMVRLASSTGLVTGAMRLLRLAVISTGIGAALVGIAAAGTWIYNNWSGIAEMFAAFREAFLGAIEPIVPLLEPVISGVSRLWGWVASLTGEMENANWSEWGRRAGEAAGAIVVWFAELPDRLAGGLSYLREAGRDMVRSIRDGARDRIDGFLAYMAGLPARIMARIGNLIDGGREMVATLRAGVSDGLLGLLVDMAGLPARILLSIGSLFSVGSTIIETMWTGASGRASILPEAITSLARRISEGIGSLYAAGQDMVQSLWDGFVAKVEEFIEYLRTLPSRFFDAIRTNLSDAISLNYGSVSDETGVGRGDMRRPDERASGGPLSINRPTWVGEEGPELIYPTRPGYVVPTDHIGAARDAAQGMAEQVEQTVARIDFAPVFQFSNVTGADAAMIEERVRRTLEQEAREAFEQIFADAGLRVG